MRRASGSVSG